MFIITYDFSGNRNYEFLLKITKIIINVFQSNADDERYSQKAKKLANFEFLGYIIQKF